MSAQLKSPDGQLVNVDDAHLQSALESGYQFVSGGEAEDLSTAKDTSDASGIGGAIGAGLTSFASGATLGASDYALKGILTKGDFQGVREEREAHPYISTASNIAGTLAPALLGDEAGLARLTPAGLTSRIGARVAERAGGGLLGTVAAGAAEGSLYNAGAYISDTALGDRDLSSEGFLGAMGKGALYGGVAAGALSLGSHGLIAARRLFPVEDLTSEGVTAAKFGAQRAIGDSVNTSTGLERVGQDAVVKTDRETQQFLTDLEQERAAALKGAAEARTAQEAAPPMPAEPTAAPTVDPVTGAPVEPPAPVEAPPTTQVTPPKSAVGEASDAAVAALDTAPAVPQSWREWTKGKMGAYMKSEGGHGPAMTAMSRDFKEYVQNFRLGATGEAADAIAAQAPKDARQLMAAWREKYPEGAVDLDTASAAARKQRLSDWAKDFEAKTPEDATIKAYYSEPQDPMRTDPDNRVGGVDAPKAVQQVARKAAADASHQAYIEATAQGANVSKSGAELMGRATYAGRKAAAQAMDDVYAAYAAGKPIVDIRAAATSRLSGQLRELAAARADMISSLAKKPDASTDLLTQLQGTKAAVDAGQPLSLGQRILQGVEKPQAAVGPDEAVEAALAKSKDVNEDISDIAPKITRYEAAKANLTEALGEKASQQAQEHAAQFRAAQQQAANSNAANVARDTDSIDATTRGVPAKQQPHGRGVIGGLAKKASDFGTAYEALRSVGVPLPDPKNIPVIGPILSMFLKAKLLSKVAGKWGGSFAATAEGTIAAKAAETQNRINGAVGRMLNNASDKLASVAPDIGGATALGFKLFDDGKQAKPYSSKPADGTIGQLYTDRLNELSAAMQPDAIATAVKSRINTSDPTILNAIIATETKKLQYLYNAIPKADPALPGQPQQLPSKAEMVAFGHVAAAAHDPAAIFERVAAGGVARPSEIDCVNNCYPQLAAMAQKKLADMLSKSSEPLPYMNRIAVSSLLGVPMDSTLKPDHAAYLQAANKSSSMPSAPVPHPTLTSSISIGDRTLTRLDR